MRRGRVVERGDFTFTLVKNDGFSLNIISAPTLSTEEECFAPISGVLHESVRYEFSRCATRAMESEGSDSKRPSKKHDQRRIVEGKNLIGIKLAEEFN